MEHKNAISLSRLCGTVAQAIGVSAPKQAAAGLDWAAAILQEHAGGPITRTLMYNPDAVAQWLLYKYRPMFQPVLARTQLALPLRSPMPSVTPVCFGTMYTGALPEVHGIQAYEKPVIQIDTLFDALVRGGKKTALVAVADSSMAKIYNDRPIDYYYLPYDDEVKEKALELIAQNQYDFISVYTQQYDDVMHRTGVESPEAMEALQNQIDCFAALADQAERCWTGHNSLSAFSPDHGVHQQPDGCGNHGQDIPEDLNIVHYLGVTRRSQA